MAYSVRISNKDIPEKVVFCDDAIKTKKEGWENKKKNPCEEEEIGEFPLKDKYFKCTHYKVIFKTDQVWRMNFWKAYKYILEQYPLKEQSSSSFEEPFLLLRGLGIK